MLGGAQTNPLESTPENYKPCARYGKYAITFNIKLFLVGIKNKLKRYKSGVA